MEGTQARLLAVLTAALAILIATLSVLEAPEGGPDQDDDRVDRQEIPADEVQRLFLRSPEGSLVAEQSDAGWWLVDPVEARGDDDALDAIVGLFDRLATSEPLEGVDPADFGLDDPEATLRLVMRGGGEHTLEVGADTPVGGDAYVRLNGGGVRVARGRPAGSLTHPPSSLRDARVARFAASAVRAIHLDLEGGWSMAARDGGWWFEDGRRASTARVEGYLAGLSALEMDGFFDGAPTPVDRGALVLTLAGGGGDPEALTVRIGEARPEGLVVQGPRAPVGALADADALAPPAASLLERRLIPAEAASLTRLDARLGEHAVALVQEDGAWRLEGGEANPAVNDAVYRLLEGAAVDREAAVEAPGAPAGAIELAIEGGEAMTIAIGPPGEAGAVGWEAGAPPFLIPPAVVAVLEALVTLGQ